MKVYMEDIIYICKLIYIYLQRTYLMKQTKKQWLLGLLALVGWALQTFAVGGDGLYFIQDFEDATQYPETKNSEAQTFTVDGQGDWIYLNAFQSTNTSYNENGSTKNLRLPKGGSYVVTPVLLNGVNKLTFYIGRASVEVSVSTDSGQTWSAASQSVSGKTVTVTIESDAVNRIKISNDTGKDADIDNIAVYAQTYDQPVVLTTAAATDITTSTAVVGGSVVQNDGQTLTETGVVWSMQNKQPTLNDYVVPTAEPASTFTLTLTELREGSTIFYRSYAKYADTQTYGPVRSFKVAIDDKGQTVDANGNYFIQDFEDLETYPQEKGAQDAEYYVANQGIWIYTNSFAATNSSYIPDGSAHDLRMPKNGSYVVTPVLNYGVKSVTFDAGRKGDKLTASISKDGGATWTDIAVSLSGTSAQFSVNDLEVNRVRIANNSSGDADIDNLCVKAQAFGTPAIVTTGNATDITKNSAVVSGTVVDSGDQPIQESGILWSLTNTLPTLADNVEKTEKPATDISVFITGLKASSTVYYRAYALTNAGYAYGETRQFYTAEATMPVVVTSEVTKSGSRYKAGGIVTDDGGLDLTAVGIIYGSQPTLSAQQSSVITLEPKTKFSTTLNLDDGTTYYVRAFATTDKGTAYGETVTVKTDEIVEKPDEIVGEEIWCSPDGDDSQADGSPQRPFFDLQKAIDIAQPGDRIWMKAGNYVYDKRININDRNGTPEAPIQVFAYGGRAVLDFSGMPYHKHSDNPYQGIRLTSSYWHFYKIDITNASDNGMLIERNKPTGGTSADIIARTQDAHDNVIEQCNFYRNGDTGLQMKNLGAYNYVINCDSYENKDEGDGDADGFAPKISVGDGNYFFGCRAWNNSDDGYDVFFKKDGGFQDNKTILMEYCLAYENGIMDGAATSGNGNGFKMGSDQGRMNVILNRCLAVRNLNKGFDQNHNSGDIILNNCTGIGQTDIGGKSYSYRIYEDLAAGSVCEISNSIAINDRLATDRSETDGGRRGQWGRWEITVASLEQTNDWKAAPELFLAMDQPQQLIGPRQADGTLPEIDYAHIDLTKGDALIDAGTAMAADGERYATSGLTIPAIEYAGEAPDLGAYETDFLLADATLPKEPTVLPDLPSMIKETPNERQKLTCHKTHDGLLIVAVQGAEASEVFTLTAYSLDGQVLGQRQFRSATVVALPSVKGPVMMKVTGKHFMETRKVN